MNLVLHELPVEQKFSTKNTTYAQHNSEAAELFEHEFMQRTQMHLSSTSNLQQTFDYNFK